MCNILLLCQGLVDLSMALFSSVGETEGAINFLNPKSDQYQLSPCKINAL